MYELRVKSGGRAKSRVTVKPQERFVPGEGDTGMPLSCSRGMLDLVE